MRILPSKSAVIEQRETPSGPSCELSHPWASLLHWSNALLGSLASKTSAFKPGLIIALGVIILELGFAKEAHALHFTLVGAYEIGSATLLPSSAGSPTYHTGSIGYGALVEFQMFKKIAMEVGGIYMPRGYSLSGTEVTFNSVQFPLLLRFYPGSAFSIGLGGYFSHGFGHVYSSPTSDPTNYSLSLYLPYGTTYSSNDMGALISVAFLIKIAPYTRLWIDFRYSYGLTNITPLGGVTTYLNDIQLVGGLRFGK